MVKDMFQTNMNNWEKYWNGELNRPLVSVMLTGFGAPVPGYQRVNALYDFSLPPEHVVDLSVRNFSTCRLLGDAYPAWYPNFGPGVLAAMIGGEGHLMPNTVWFSGGALSDVNPEDLTFKFDPDSPWAKRIYEISKAGAKRDLDELVVGITDLGGATDILASFRHGEAFLLDLYDRPETVKRLVNEIHTAWHEAYKHFRTTLGADYPYSSWACMLSQKSHHMLQSDVSYMISPELFGEFVLPELKKSCLKMERPFYHLDGKGELPHLDQLLAIEELAGIQWIPGEGSPPLQEWPDVLNKIADSGKKLQLIAPIDHVAKAIKVVHNVNAVTAFGWGDASDLALAEGLVTEYR
jgi:5-methyltetrahydrofolate--homocysteine methyltransferase